MDFGILSTSKQNEPRELEKVNLAWEKVISREKIVASSVRMPPQTPLLEGGALYTKWEEENKGKIEEGKTVGAKTNKRWE